MPRTVSLTQSITFEIIDCVTCHIVMAIPQEMIDRLRSDGQGFFCLNGHPQNYGETETNKLRKQLASERASRAALADQLAAAERERKRQEKRAKAGVCPCCHRSYVQVARHMKSQHPDFAAT